MKSKDYTDPMLNRLYRSIRSLRQAQRRAVMTYRTMDEVREALDTMQCNGLITSNTRHRITREADGFTIELA